MSKSDKDEIDPRTTTELELFETLARHEARENFWGYRKYITPNMIDGWWQREVSVHLQQFYTDFKAKKRPVLVLTSPPQHGKSVQVVDLISWIAGLDPSLKTIFASFSDRLGVRANMRLQRIYDSPRYMQLFGQRINSENIVTQVGRYLRNSEILEYVGSDGYFRNATINGAVTGEGLDIGVIDDPIKGRKEASSVKTRQGVWDWLTDDFMTRFSDAGALLMIMTRWHVDDPTGRLLESDPAIKVLHYPAIAEHDEEHRKKGEALFPELKPVDFLLKRKKVMSQAGWESVYQQRPIVIGGGMFPIEKFETVQAIPNRGDVLKAVRYWDKAGTKDGGAYTAGVLILKCKDGTFVVADVRRGQWQALDREKIIKQCAQADKQLGYSVTTYVEQEPGSGGKESAENTIRSLVGFNARADKVTGDKITRAEPYSAQVQAGNIKVLDAYWTRDFIDEHELFPAGKYKDQVDAASGAFNKLAESGYDRTMSWVQ